jgi:hypothetical protein
MNITIYGWSIRLVALISDPSSAYQSPYAGFYMG